MLSRRTLVFSGLAAAARPANIFAADSSSADFELVRDGRITQASVSPGRITTIVDHHGGSISMNGELLNLPASAHVRVVLREAGQSFSEIEVTPLQVKDSLTWSRSFALAGISISSPLEKQTVVLVAPENWRIVSAVLAKNNPTAKAGNGARYTAIDVKMERHTFPAFQP